MSTTLRCECGAPVTERQNFYGACGRANVYNPAVKVSVEVSKDGTKRTACLPFASGVITTDTDLRFAEYNGQGPMNEKVNSATWTAPAGSLRCADIREHGGWLRRMVRRLLGLPVPVTYTFESRAGSVVGWG